MFISGCPRNIVQNYFQKNWKEYEVGFGEVEQGKGWFQKLIILLLVEFSTKTGHTHDHDHGF